MNANLPVYILDSYAVLAHLEGEAGQATVGHILADAQAGRCNARFSLINLGEVLYMIERERGLQQAYLALAGIQQLPIEIVPASQEMVFAATHIKATCAVSYADAFTIAAAQAYGGIVLTGDREFEQADGLVKIQWLPG
jgi:predicted nucleic acid-binding protein